MGEARRIREAGELGTKAREALRAEATAARAIRESFRIVIATMHKNRKQKQDKRRQRGILIEK